MGEQDIRLIVVVLATIFAFIGLRVKTDQNDREAWTDQDDEVKKFSVGD